MTRRPTWLSAAVIGGAIGLLSMSAVPVFAQAAPAAPAEGGYTVYPDYAEVACDGTFNGVPYTGNLAKIEATDASTVVFTLCAAPTRPSCPRSRSRPSPSTMPTT